MSAPAPRRDRSINCIEFDVADIAREQEDALYGRRDFGVRDLDGHLLAFGHELDAGDAGPGLAA